MGSKSQKQTVYDFLMSLDYGICHGPIDHLNMVWIKDKPILCDRVSERTDVEIFLPELFGGDTAEGGVGGTLEVYMGTEDQFASSELSSRDGRTVTEMPGYRGLCHLFFRGFREASASEQLDNLWGDGLNLWSQLIKKLLTGDLNGLKGRNTLGWVWGSNNPYTPAMKASVTRLPRQLNAAYKAIWPLGAEFGSAGDAPADLTPQPLSIIRDDNGVGVDPTAPGTVIDLLERGATQEQIDAGEVLLRVTADVTLRSWDSTASANLVTNVRFYDEVPTVWDQTQDEIAPVVGEGSSVSVSTVFNLSENTPTGYTGSGQTYIEEVTAPVGSRYVQIMSGYNAVDAYRVTSEGNYILAIDQSFDELDEDEPFEFPPADEYRIVASGTYTMWPVTPWRLGTVVDLLSLGITEEQIDSGLVRAGALVILGEEGELIPVLDDGIASRYMTNIRFHRQEPINYYDSPNLSVFPEGGEPPEVSTEFNSGSPDGPVEVPTIAVRPTTRFVQFQGGYIPAVGRNTQFEFVGYQILVADGETYAPVWCQPNQELGPLPDANPAHVIYEALTDPDWGKGESPALINNASFEAASELFYNERMGVSIGWFQQSSIEDFIGEVLDHVQAFLFQDPSTGLWELKPLRDDYDLEDAFVLNEGNCVATNRKRRLWGETTNEIVVSYTDPVTEKSATVSAHNLSNIAIQGGISSETRDYYGFRNPNIAQVVAERDVAEAGYPLFSCEIDVDRHVWLARPGDVAVFSWAEDGIEQVVLRVMSVDYGSTSDRTVRLTLSEDIFSVDKATYSAPQTTNWSRGGAGTGTPTPLEAQAAVSVPLPMVLRNGYTVEEVEERYPNTLGVLLGDDDDKRPSKIQVRSRVTNATGSSEDQKIADIDVAVSGRISRAWVEEAESQVPDTVISGIKRLSAQPGDFFMLGLSELESELVMLVSLDSTSGYWTVARGMWDTVPRAWPTGTRIWSFSLTVSNADPRERAAGETVTYTLLPVTNLGVLPRAQAEPLTVTYTERPHAPFRPANAQIEGRGFGSFIVTEAPFPTEIEVTWTNRNRETEDVVALRWDDDSVGVEVGQTTVLRILNTDGSEHGVIEDLTGESHTIAAALLPPAGAGYIEFLSERDGIRSIMGARRFFSTQETGDIGYGLGYGIGYGGALATP